MEFIESLTVQALTTAQGIVTASPLLFVAALVLALILCSGLAARIVEAFEVRSGSFDQVRRAATDRLRAAATELYEPHRHRSHARSGHTHPRRRGWVRARRRIDRGARSGLLRT